MAENLATCLRDKIDVLQLVKDERSGDFSWQKHHSCRAMVEIDSHRNLFSVAGVGARGAKVTVRAREDISLRHAIIWNGEFLHLSAIEPVKTRDRTEIRAAICLPVTLTAKPQDRTGRDELNRPVAIKQAEFRFPGVLAEMYHRNESDEVYRTTTQRRVLVTPKEISLRVGDLVQYEEESAYTVRQVMDLEAHKNEYIIERQEDV